jgi:H+/Cl- antiporter ClcA
MVELIIFLGFGIAAGLFGMAFVKLAKWRNKKESIAG